MFEGQQQVSKASEATWRVDEDGRLHRKRVKSFPNGNEYNCEFVGDKPDGFGTLKTSQGMHYEGNFLNGLFHGHAKVVWIDEFHQVAKTFIGEFKRGKRSGHGVLSDEHVTWDGNFAHDQFHGQGTLWKKTTGERFKGQWVNGKLHCDDGLIAFQNGDKYEGPVHLGKINGDVGHYTFKDGGFYTGQHKVGIKHGIGTRKFVDGTTFRGDMINGNLCGHGIMTYGNSLDHKKRYEGEWEDGLFDGNGELYFQESSPIEFYKGDFKHGKYYRYGRLQYRDGSFYEGRYHEGYREGRGKRLWRQGNWFEGEWQKDMMLNGRYFDASANSTYVGAFERNKKHGLGKESWRSQNNREFRDPCFGWQHAADELVTYKGSYFNGYFDGNGRFEAPNGRHYDGGWRLGKPHGLGTMQLLRRSEFGNVFKMHIGKHGSLYRPEKYSGEWKDGKRHGQGTLFFLDGSSKQISYIDGNQT